MPKITHLIYDLDGLLLDTETLHTKVNQMIANRYGETIDPELKFKLCGRKSTESAKLIVETLKLPLTVETYIQEKDTIIYQYYANVPPLPGAVRLTQHFAAHQIPQAIATSSSRRPFAAKTQNHQAWFSIFQYIIQGDHPSIKQGKPAPDIFLITAEKLGAKPEQCLVFEDSLAGVAAARAAQMSVVAVPASDIDKSLYTEADLVLNSLTEFKPQDWGLPAFKQ